MTTPHPARDTYQALAWLEKFSPEPTERDQCRAALDELDRHRRRDHNDDDITRPA